MVLKRIKAILIEAALRLAVADVRMFGKFDREFYLRTNEDVGSSGQDPIRHYLLHGSFEDRQVWPEATARSPEKLLLVRFYYRLVRLLNPQLSQAQWNDLRTISASGLFDARYYLDSYDDVRESASDPLMHFVTYGYKEGRNPGPGFDTRAYATMCGIGSNSDINPLVHYIRNLASGEGTRAWRAENDGEDRIGPNAVDDFGSPIEGYTQWRRSFVTVKHLADIRAFASLQKITLCLVCTGQNEDEISRTLDSLAKQGAIDGMAVIGTAEDTGAILSRSSDFEEITAGAIHTAVSLSEFFRDAAFAPGFIGFLTVGDQLLPGAVEQLRTALVTHPDALVHYSDEETVDLQNALVKPLFKGCFDPDLQRASDYMGNFLAISTSLAIPDLASIDESWPVTRYMLVNHLLDQLTNATVNRIPEILYRRINRETWPNDHMDRLARSILDIAQPQMPSLAIVTPAGDHALRLGYRLPAADNSVSIIIPTRNGIDVLRPCIESILQKTDYPSYELVILDNGSDEQAAIDYLKTLDEQYANVSVIQHGMPFNYSELNNIGARAAKGEYLVFLNNDIEVIGEDWLRELISHAARPEIGVVGALLLFPDDTIQHAGVVTGVGGVAAHAFSGWNPDSSEFAIHNHTRRVSAVTGACMAVRREVFDNAGGFDEDNLPVDFNDVDLCMRVSESGLGVLFTPHARLYHHESKTRISHVHDSTEAERFSLEVQWMQERWFNALGNDPFYSPNYSLGLPGYALAWPPRKDKTRAPVPPTPNLDLYVSQKNPQRAESIVRTMGRTPGTLNRLEHETGDRKPGLSVIILNLDKPEYIVPLIKSLDKADTYFDERGCGLEILIGDTGSSDPGVLEMYASAASFVKILTGLKYNFSRCNNQVFTRLSRYDTVLFLNNDIEFSGDPAATLFEMYRFLQNTPDAGVVGAQLLFPDKTIQHVGIGVFESGWLRGFVYHPDAGKPAFPKASFPRKTWAVTGACLMIKSADFIAVNGFDEAYRAECQDAALCMEIRRRGLQSYVLAPGEITHFENGTREKGSEDWPDRQRFMRHWGGWIDMELGEMGR